MSFRDIVLSWTTWNKLSGNHDDDWVDRLNHIYTVVLLVVSAMFVAGGAYTQDTIACWIPADITPNQAKYVHNYCWIKNTYYVPLLEEIPGDAMDRRDLEVTYYQYIPVILLFMAFLFKLPCVVWRVTSGYSGINLSKIVSLTLEAQYAQESKRADKVNDIAVTIDRWLESNRQYHWNFLVRLKQKASRICFILNRREGTYLTGLYLIVKLLYTANIVVQFVLLNAFLGGFFTLWGIEAINNLPLEYQLKESRRFPRITLCDFKIRLLQNVMPYTVQCVLPLNLYNEKIFVVLWFWFILVSICTVVSLLVWTARTLCRQTRVGVVKKYLKLDSRLHTELDKKICKNFSAFLRDDGAFLIRMVQKNSTDILVTDLVTRLWDIYLNKPIVKKTIEAAEANGHGPHSLKQHSYRTP